MKKFKRSEEKVVGHLLHCAHNKEITQFILNTIGRENWTKSILSNCTQSVLTEEQKELNIDFVQFSLPIVFSINCVISLLCAQ